MKHIREMYTLQISSANYCKFWKRGILLIEIGPEPLNRGCKVHRQLFWRLNWYYVKGCEIELKSRAEIHQSQLS